MSSSSTSLVQLSAEVASLAALGSRSTCAVHSGRGVVTGTVVAPGRVVLYPHFNDYVTPGWLDKHLRWRRAPRGHRWLDDVLLIAPSPSFLSMLPNGKLPDRRDFYRYGSDHAGRERAWSRAVAECERFAVDAFGWLLRPDPTLVRPL